MPEIGLKALKNEASQVIEAVEGGARYVVTKRGRPAAVILSMREAEDFVLAHAQEFVSMRLAGRAAHSAGRSTRLD
jgi:prevent-host-death family protein